MPILSRVGRKSFKGTMVLCGIYLVLLVGAITMLYPFLLMLSGSIASNHSEYEFRLIPRYLYDQRGLFETQVFNKYYRYGGISDIEQQWKVSVPGGYGSGESPWTQIPGNPPPQSASLSAKIEYQICRKPDLADPRVQRRIADYNEFRGSVLPPNLRDCYWIGGRSRTFEGDELYRNFLRDRYGTIEAQNQAYNTQATSWPQVFAPYDRLHNRSIFAEDTPQQQDWLEFKASLDARWVRPPASEFWWSEFLSQRYDDSIAKLNSAYGTNYARFFDVGLSVQQPATEPAASDWTEYVRTRLAVRFMGFEGGEELWHKFQQSRLGRVEMPALSGNPPSKAMNDVLLEFVATSLPLEHVRILTAENLYRNFLLDRYVSLAGINDAHGLNAATIEQIYFPMPEVDWQELTDHPWQIRWYTLSRAYRTAIDHILHHRRSLYNTAVFCAFAVAGALVVNPLCAYALSRFNLPAAYQILLFLLATMAFPAEVTIIPNFLLIKGFPLLRIVCGLIGCGIGISMTVMFFAFRKPLWITLGGLFGALPGSWFVSDAAAHVAGLVSKGEVSLLNTYWALVLPGLASGYSIFILKGFFDSLPAELYEAATIDGAGETRIFSTITLPLSKPVLAVIALWTFTAAYGSFTWALIICQDERMWTLMVHLYQYQLYVDACERLAGFTLASIPTLAVFILTQKMILKGVVLPSFK